MVGGEDDEQDMGQVETGMRNEMFREEDMEDDEDESVSYRCLFMCAAFVCQRFPSRCIMRCTLYLRFVYGVKNDLCSDIISYIVTIQILFFYHLQFKL